MPITYEIDVQAGLIVTIATGVLTNQELLEHKRRLSRDPNIRAGMVELSDVRGIDRLEVTAEGVWQFVAHDGADGARFADYRLAIVASEAVVYGMARMYQMMTERSATVAVFKTMSDARAWLGAGTA